MSVNVRDWLDRDPKSVDIYRLLGRKVFDPDYAAVRKAVQDAIRGVLPYQSHSDRAIAAKAVELQYAIARASDLIGQKEKLRSYHRELLADIHHRLANRIGPRTDASVVRQLLIEAADIHPDSVGVVWEVFRGIDEESCAARLEFLQEHYANPAVSAESGDSKGIEFHCPGCGNLMRTTQETAGRKGKCPLCGHKLRIPQQSLTGPNVSRIGQSVPATTNPDSPAAWHKQTAATYHAEESPLDFMPKGSMNPADLFPPTHARPKVMAQHAEPSAVDPQIETTVAPHDVADLLPQAVVGPNPYSVDPNTVRVANAPQPTDSGFGANSEYAAPLVAIPLPNSTTSHTPEWSPRLISSDSDHGLNAAQRNRLRRQRRIRYIGTTVICWLVALLSIVFAVFHFSGDSLHVQWRLQTKRDVQSTGTFLTSIPADDRSPLVVVEVSFTPELYGVSKTTSGWECDVKPSFFTLRLPDGAVQSANLLKFNEAQLLPGEYVHVKTDSPPKSLEMTAIFVLPHSALDSGNPKFQFKDHSPIPLDATNRATN